MNKMRHTHNSEKKQVQQVWPLNTAVLGTDKKQRYSQNGGIGNHY